LGGGGDEIRVRISDCWGGIAPARLEGGRGGDGLVAGGAASVVHGRQVGQRGRAAGDRQGGDGGGEKNPN
jgi:hypothetical protein